MIPQMYSLPFLACKANPDKGIMKPDVEVGHSVMIMEEFTKRPKLQGFLYAKVKLINGEERLMSLNKTSYDEIRLTYGPDTNGWVGKYLEFEGEQPMGNMRGFKWKAVKE